MHHRRKTVDARARHGLRVSLATIGSALCLAGGAAALPASALATPVAHNTSTTSSVAPPGNSAVSQYSEDLPTAGGGKSTSKVNAAGSTSSSTAASAGISKQTYQQLQSSGSAGKATAALAAATGVSSADVVGKSTTSDSAKSAAELASASPASQLMKTVDGSSGGGIGSALPIVLIVALVGISGLGLFLRRNRS